MRYFKIIGLFCFFSALTNVLQAQDNYTSASLSIGQFIRSPVSGNSSFTFFSRKDISQTSRFGPEFSLGIESIFAKKWGVGLSLSYVSAESDRDTRTTGSILGNSRVIEKVSSNAGGGALSMKYFFHQDKELSFYVTGSLGAFFVSENATTTGGVQNIYLNYWILLNGGVGVRYFWSEKLGAFSEFGYRRLGPPHGGHFNCGLILKI